MDLFHWKELLIQLLHVLLYEIFVKIILSCKGFINVLQVLRDRHRLCFGMLLCQDWGHLSPKLSLLCCAQVMTFLNLLDNCFGWDLAQGDLTCFEIVKQLLIIYDFLGNFINECCAYISVDTLCSTIFVFFAMSRILMLIRPPHVGFFYGHFMNLELFVVRRGKGPTQGSVWINFVIF